MKILHLNFSDIQGGAARAAYRLHQGLQYLGVESQMLVQQKASDDETVISPRTKIAEGLARTRISFDVLPTKLYPQRKAGGFSVQWLPDRILPKIKKIDPDIIHLHWINQAFIQIETLASLGKPIVWTLHDMWAFTGGCHYSGDCYSYKSSCGSCTQLNSNRDWDLSRLVWLRKARAWKNLDLTVVAPSNWLAECAKSSSLFKDVRVEVIHHGIDLENYKPVESKVARDILGLPQNKQLILFGAIKGTKDTRKGFNSLVQGLQKLYHLDEKRELELIVFGASKPTAPTDIKYKANYVGHIYDDVTLKLIYSAADLTVVPSTQEAFGQTAFESLACGTPVAAFDTTGLKDIIDHEKNGYLAKPFDSEDLALGINWLLKDKERSKKLSKLARQKVEQAFNLKLQSKQYYSLFTKIKYLKNI